MHVLTAQCRSTSAQTAQCRRTSSPTHIITASIRPLNTPTKILLPDSTLSRFSHLEYYCTDGPLIFPLFTCFPFPRFSLFVILLFSCVLSSPSIFSHFTSSIQFLGLGSVSSRPAPFSTKGRLTLVPIVPWHGASLLPSSQGAVDLADSCRLLSAH